MTKLSGQCLCGDVTFKINGDVAVQANCHCTDCQQATGAAYATLLFFNKDDVDIDGETKSFSHTVDSGSVLSKAFCPTCGSPMFGTNDKRQGLIAVRGGIINEKAEVTPKFNVYTSSKMDCTILDPALPAFEKMPG